MTLDEYIIENAGRSADASFLRRFSASEVFFSLQHPPGAQLPAVGTEMSSGAVVHLRIAKLDVGPMGLFYASKDDRRLGDSYAGLPLIKAAQLVCETSDVDGLLVQSSGDAWLAARKEGLREAIGQVRDKVFYKDFLGS